MFPHISGPGELLNDPRGGIALFAFAVRSAPEVSADRAVNEIAGRIRLDVRRELVAHAKFQILQRAKRTNRDAAIEADQAQACPLLADQL